LGEILTFLLKWVGIWSGLGHGCDGKDCLLCFCLSYKELY